MAKDFEVVVKGVGRKLKITVSCEKKIGFDKLIKAGSEVKVSFVQKK